MIWEKSADEKFDKLIEIYQQGFIDACEEYAAEQGHTKVSADDVGFGALRLTKHFAFEMMNRIETLAKQFKGKS